MSAEEVLEIVERVKPLLGGQPPEVQGAVLAQLLSLWLAGHYQVGPEVQERLLAHHIAMVRRLTSVDVEVLKRRASMRGAASPEIRPGCDHKVFITGESAVEGGKCGLCGMSVYCCWGDDPDEGFRHFWRTACGNRGSREGYTTIPLVCPHCGRPTREPSQFVAAAEPSA